MNYPKIPNGYILLSRNLIESEIMRKPPLYIKVWIWLLLKAQHTEYKQLKRGQLITSIPEMQREMSYKIGYRIKKPTTNEIWKVLEWLRNPCEDDVGEDDNKTMIKTIKVTHGILVNICKYDYYQQPQNYEANHEVDNEKRAKELRSRRQIDNINKKDKNDKNEENKVVSKKQSSFDDLIGSYTDNSQLKETIIEFIRMRTNKRAKLTNKALELIFKKLDSYAANDYEKIKILENSIMNGWSGIFELKEVKGGVSSGTNSSHNGTYNGIDTSKFRGKLDEREPDDTDLI